MYYSVKVIIFVFTIFLIVGFQRVQGLCNTLTINGNHCFPPNADTCSTNIVQNGTGLTWFDMENNCSSYGGRLVFMGETFDKKHLLSIPHHNAHFLAIGMMMSFEGDNKTFWINPTENNTFSCGLKDTKICLSSTATRENCNLIGCCWVNGKCQYPEWQWLAETNISTGIDTSAVVTTTERTCVGLDRNSSKLMAYNCSLPAAKGTGYVCEYKCGRTDWPVLPQQNITSSTVINKPEVTSTGKATVELLTTPSQPVSFDKNATTFKNVLLTTASKQGFGLNTSKPISGNKTDTGNSRNNSAVAFKRKVRRIVSRQYFLYEYLDYSGV